MRIKCRSCHKVFIDEQGKCPECGSSNLVQLWDNNETVASESIQNAIKTTPVILVIFYSIITFGIYVPLWFLHRLDGINQLSSDEKLEKGVFNFFLLLTITSVVLGIIVVTFCDYLFEFKHSYTFKETSELAESASSLIDLFLWLSFIFQSFKVKKIFNNYFNVKKGRGIKFSVILTLLFTIYYLQFKINRLDRTG